LRLLLILSLPLTAGALALGPGALRLDYGEDYGPAGNVLLILVAPFPLVPLVHYTRSSMTGLGRLRASFIVNAFAALANIGLDFLLIPGRGATAAAVANACAQVVAGVPALIYMTRGLQGVEWRPGPLLRAAVC